MLETVLYLAVGPKYEQLEDILLYELGDVTFSGAIQQKF